MQILYAHHNDSYIKTSASTFSLVASLTSFCNALYLRAVLIRYFLLFSYCIYIYVIIHASSTSKKDLAHIKLFLQISILFCIFAYSLTLNLVMPIYLIIHAPSILKKDVAINRLKNIYSVFYKSFYAYYKNHYCHWLVAGLYISTIDKATAGPFGPVVSPPTA